MKAFKITNYQAWQEVRDNATEIDSIRQDCEQFDNFSVTLLRLKGGGLIAIEDCLSHSNQYLLDDTDSLKAADWANDWANNGEGDYRLEMIAWGLSDVDDYAVDDDYTGECKIIEVGNFYGPYSPVKYVKDGNGNYDDQGVIFATKEEAQEWIDEQEEGNYYLSHNEAGSPSYTIVEV